MQIKLGSQAKDIISGFKGTVTGYVQYISGCNQYLLSAKVAKDGALKESHWFDEQRVEALGGKRVVLKNQPEHPGHAEAAPIR